MRSRVALGRLAFVLTLLLLAGNARAAEGPAMLPIFGNQSRCYDQCGNLFAEWACDYDLHCADNPGCVFHPGWDVNLVGEDDGENIYAIADGTVILDCSRSRVIDGHVYYWGVLEIRHVIDGVTFYSQYGHVKEVFVSDGQQVKKGNRIALLGSVDARSPHLHWEIRVPEHPDESNPGYWTCELQDESQVRSWYRDPEPFVANLDVEAEARLSNGQVGSKVESLDWWPILDDHDPYKPDHTAKSCYRQDYRGPTWGDCAIVFDALGGARRAYTVRTGFWHNAQENGWEQQGGPGSDLGMPITDEYGQGGSTTRQEFQKKYLYFNGSIVSANPYPNGGPGWTSAGWNNQYSYLFALAYERNGARNNVGEATGLVHDYGSYKRQDFTGGSFGDCCIMYDPDNASGNPSATNEAYLLKLGFYQHYNDNGGWAAFGCPSRDEYHPDTGNAGDEIQFFFRIQDHDDPFHYMYYEAALPPGQQVSWHSAYTAEWVTQSPNEPLDVEQGTTLRWTVQYRNTGTTTWFQDSERYPYDYAALKSCDEGGTVVPSLLYDLSLGWGDSETPCTMQEASVPPGGVATFSFHGRIPADASLGQHNVYFRPEHSLAGLLGGWGGMHYIITVVPPAPGCPSDPGSLVANGGFTGSDCWTTMDTYGATQFNFDGALHAVATPGVYYDVGVYQLLPIVDGDEYSISFRAWSSEPCSLWVTVQDRNPEWKPYGLWQRIDVSGAPRPVWEVFQATVTDPHARLLFALGAVSGEVWIDDVVLRRINCQREPGQLVGDPNFETLDCWRPFHWSKPSSQYSVEQDGQGGRRMAVTVLDPGQFWETQLRQENLPIEHGKRYLLSEIMESDRPMDVFTAVANGQDRVLGAWDSLRITPGAPIPIESMAFTVPDTVSADSAKLIYFLGKNEGTCKIGQPLLQELHCELDPGGMIGDGQLNGRDCWTFQHRMRDRFTVGRDSDGRMAGRVFASADSDSAWVTQIRQEHLRLRKDKRYHLHAEVMTTTPGGIVFTQLTIPGRHRNNWKVVYSDSLQPLSQYHVTDVLLTPPADSDSAMLGFVFGRVSGDYWVRDVRLEEWETCVREPGDLIACPQFEKPACWALPAGATVTDGVAEIPVVDSHSDSWAVTLHQGTIVLTNRWKYQLSFEAKCTTPGTSIRLYVGGDQARTAGNILRTSTVTLGTDWGELFSIEGFSDLSTDSAFVAIGIGAQAGTYSFRNVHLEMVPDSLDNRDKYKQPFARNSIWNTPIGSGARFVPAGFRPGKAVGIDDDYFIVTSTSDSEYDILDDQPGWLTHRCQGNDSTGVKTRFPYDLIVSDVRPGWTPNNSAAILQPEGEWLVQCNGLARCEPGGPVYGVAVSRDSVAFPNESIYGDGIIGGHGGSLLSSIGGSIRRGELVSGAPIRHALKVNIWCQEYAYPDSGGYRWPASKSDGNCWDHSCTTPLYGGSNRALRLGSLLAIPQELWGNRQSLHTEAAKKLFDALRYYGAYIADNSNWDCYYLCAERGVREETEAFYGHSIDLIPDTEYHQDVDHLFEWLSIVDNNTPESIGGPGERIAYQVVDLQDPTPAVPMLEAQATEGGIALSWHVPADVIALSFQVYRRAPGEDWRSVSPLLRPKDGECRWVDMEVQSGILFEYEVDVIGPSGSVGRWGPVSCALPVVPTLWFRVTPNPGSSGSSLAFGLPQAGDATLRVFDVSGREVARQMWAGLYTGTHRRSWEAKDRYGRPLSSGLYWLQLTTPTGEKTIRWTVVR